MKTHALLNYLVGNWAGNGRGYFPTISSFEYRETVVFTWRDQTTLFFDQRTEKRYNAGEPFEVSHWESGFIRILDNDQLEMINAQSGGRAEVLTGHVIASAPQIELHFTSTQEINDARMIATSRTFQVTETQLNYQMWMHTTTVDHIQPHLEAVLSRSERNI